MPMEHSPVIDHVLGHKTSLNKFKRVEIIQSVFSDHDTVFLQNGYIESIQSKKSPKN